MSDPRRGFVLVTVLWLITLLSALAMAASMTFRGFAAVVAVDWDRTQAQVLLAAGLEAAAHSVEALGGTPLDQLDISVALRTGSVRARISDEGGRIDIGKAPVEVLAALFRSIGVPARQADDIARSVAEWRKLNTAAPSPAAPARAADAPSPAAPAKAADAPSPAAPAKAADAGQPFTDIHQLLLIPGTAPEWVAAIAPLTTVYGSETVNPLTASAQVLATLPGTDAARITAFMQVRHRAPADTQQLASMLGTAQSYLGVNTGPVVARVDLVARVGDGFTEGAQAVAVLMPGDSEPYRVLVWNALVRGMP
jgi:general secretion pathway protein K